MKTPYEFIEQKQQNSEHSADEIRDWITRYTANEIPDEVMSAWLMAVYFNGMTDREIAGMVDAMLHSGEVLSRKAAKPQIRVDKHSTGGVGDKTSIILAPLLATFGLTVPMISGRGLGHTGGTLDKLESIPGFSTQISETESENILQKIGVCMMGQTKSLVPADKKLYALRDVTATVRSIPLITASIMSKKIAEDLDALVLDVKTGNGAFMSNFNDAKQLAKLMVAVGKRFDIATSALITDMSQPLGNACGNWVEILECVECLKGNGPADLMDLTYALSAELLVGAKLSETRESAQMMLQNNIENGKALEKFVEMVEIQGGDISAIENWKPDSLKRQFVVAKQSGGLNKIDTYKLGFRLVEMGAGRKKITDKIDPMIGVILHKKLGDSVEKDEPLCEITSKNGVSDDSVAAIGKCFSIGESCEKLPLVLEIL